MISWGYSEDEITASQAAGVTNRIASGSVFRSGGAEAEGSSASPAGGTSTDSPAAPRGPTGSEGAGANSDLAGAVNLYWCPWCGESGTGGDFCDTGCMLDYWRDVKGTSA